MQELTAGFIFLSVQKSPPGEVGHLEAVIRHAAHSQVAGSSHWMAHMQPEHSLTSKMVFLPLSEASSSKGPLVTHCPDEPLLRDRQLFRPSGTGSPKAACSSLLKGPGSLASLSQGCEISLPLHPQAQGGITNFSALLLLNNSANSIRRSRDFLMFGQAVNIVILAHVNKCRQVWVLVIFLEAGFFFFFSLSFFLSYPLLLGFKALSRNRCVNVVKLYC